MNEQTYVIQHAVLHPARHLLHTEGVFKGPGLFSKLSFVLEEGKWTDLGHAFSTVLDSLVQGMRHRGEEYSYTVWDEGMHTVQCLLLQGVKSETRQMDRQTDSTVD